MLWRMRWRRRAVSIRIGVVVSRRVAVGLRRRVVRRLVPRVVRVGLRHHRTRWRPTARRGRARCAARPRPRRRPAAIRQRRRRSRRHRYVLRACNKVTYNHNSFHKTNTNLTIVTANRTTAKFNPSK